MRGIEPPCAAWEAAVLPLNYTREEIFDFRFSIADCNRNKFALQIAVVCAALSASSRRRVRESAEDSARLQHSILNDHCHEITSSEAENVVVPLLNPGDFASLPADHAITP